VSNSYFSWQESDLHLRVYVQPGSSANQVVGLFNGALKIKLTAPPVDGKANQSLLKYLARQFGVPTRNVMIMKGHSGRAKQICITLPKAIPEWLV
jgi:uncharacterized protein (TIGR00251 family)